MAIQDVWFSNLKALIESEGGGRRGIRAVADATGLSEEYVYQLAEKKQNSKGIAREVGKSAAKKISDAFANGRPDGWFDAITATATLTAPSPTLVATGSAQNHALAPVQQALPATNNVASLDVTLGELTAYLAQVEPSRRESVVTLMASLVRTPDDDGLRAALTALLTPSGFADQHRLAA